MTKDECRKLIRRIAWNLNYRERKKLSKECPILYGFGDRQNISDYIGKNVLVEELLKQLSNEKERYIIQKTVLEGFTCKEISKELNMTERGVNQCKNRSLKKLYHYLITHSKGMGRLHFSREWGLSSQYYHQQIKDWLPTLSYSRAQEEERKAMVDEQKRLQIFRTRKPATVR
ncbi:sigma factor-like helix-turn-helix DNA-binding protein [Brevibacillus agri]|nr:MULTISPECIES: sigma factor-like helix-turn-helix DNA-binding protein [Brevibacillus]MED4572782.1 sigma factor-like helix-turn-helix DNA-binding protein [Brevibacillus agri]QHZ55037.1 sigma-70 family RNA polymerase sigma factor [Brevibacillus sp. NSP2.1]QHZ58384.1 sigma-70 family RNA polymerase sigma factor [Brevibacillus sp. NSP2.1]WHX31456.1 sigma factor-like helix-turn-helix DNA-binding protein [Brevibacillus agri]